MSFLPEGWSESSPGGLAANPDPINGGIIDRAIVSGEWFIVFNRDDLPSLDGFSSRDDAFRAVAECLQRGIEEEPCAPVPGAKP